MLMHLSASSEPVVCHNDALPDRAMYLPVQGQQKRSYQGNGLQHELLALCILHATFILSGLASCGNDTKPNDSFALHLLVRPLQDQHSAYWSG